MCTLHTAMFSALLLNMMPSKDQLEIEHKVGTTSCQTTPGVAMTTSLILIVQVSNQFTAGGLYRWSGVTTKQTFPSSCGYNGL